MQRVHLLVLAARQRTCVVSTHTHEPWPSILRATPRGAPAGLAFNALFTLELVLRMAAAGGAVAYISQPWNTFDFVMVAAGAGGGFGVRG